MEASTVVPIISYTIIMSSPKKVAKQGIAPKNEPEASKPEPPKKKEAEPAQKLPGNKAPPGNPQSKLLTAELPIKPPEPNGKKPEVSPSPKQPGKLIETSNQSDPKQTRSERPSKSPSPEKNTRSSFSKGPESPFSSKYGAFKELNSIKEVTQSPVVSRKQITKDPNPFKANSKKEQESIEDIDGKIKSRRRLLDMLESQTSGYSEDMLLQIQTRDSLIHELSSELIDIKSQMKQGKTAKDAEDDIKLKKLQQRVLDLEQERAQQENIISELVEKSKIDYNNTEEQKLHFEMLQEAMNEEMELLKTQLHNKKDENHSMLEDIKKLSEIIQQFKNLNNELNKKIDKQNNDLETLKVKYYESEIKASTVSDLEANLEEYIRIYKKTESRANQNSEEVRVIQLQYEDLYAYCKYTEDQLSIIITSLEQESNVTENLKNIRDELGRRRKIEVNTYVAEDIKDERIRELNLKLEKSLRECKVLENSHKPLLDEIYGMKELIEYLKSEHADAIKHLNQAMKTIQDQNEALKADIQNLRLEIGKREVKITALNSKIINYDNKEIRTDEKMKKIIESRSLIEKENTENKSKLNTFKTQLLEKQNELKILQKQVGKLQSHIQSLHEEFWKKDTALLKGKKTILQLQKTISDMNSYSNKLENSKQMDGSEKLLRELYEKDQKIELLKDMLASVKNKQKDKSNKRSEMSTDINLYEMHPEKFEKSEQVLMNSLAAKCINKFFSLCSFQRNAGDPLPDISRLIKKLRQDLKLYSAFSVKDLQSSVPQLQSALVDSKSHLALDELITIINKVVYS